nr:hypothetical protein [uncultured Flavobacterium sp.]
MIDKLPAEASIYGDSAYTDYGLEDIVLERKCILLKSQRKSNTKRTDTLEQKNEKLKMRKRVETTISGIKKMFSRTNTCSNIGRFSNKTYIVCIWIPIKQIN